MTGGEEAVGKDVKGGGVQVRVSEAEGLNRGEGKVRGDLLDQFCGEKRERHELIWLG